MGNGSSENYHLPSLLRFGDLDVRSVAANNISLLVGEYFYLLSNFINHAPETADALGRIASLGGNDNDFQTLTGFITVLEGIGCDKLLSAVDEIIKAGQRGERKTAATRARKTQDELNAICARIKAAKKEAKTHDPVNVLGADGQGLENSDLSYEAHPLKKILQLLDHEEATRKLRILAIDDAPVTLKIISSVLSNEYKVYGMTDPTMLENFLHQITPELFILDYKMPALSGFDLVPIIRSFEEHKTTPIIFLTSLGTANNISTAVKLGACDFVVKPFQAEILREKISKHIVRKVFF